MNHTLSSPVSPLEESHVVQQQHTPLPTQESPENSDGDSSSNASSDTQVGNWIPFTLRWYFLLLPATLSLCLGIVLVYLCLHSRRYYGLGADDGSSAILFDWRFTPTLIAVLYAQMTVILFEDIKRTEPFARLAKPPPGGSSAYGTILQTPRAWWTVFIDVAFKRKQVGKTSWTLICSAFINVLALLAISPLSSALLTSEEVLVPKTLSFARIVPTVDGQIPTAAGRETYFRTISALTRNVTTSAWTSDQSLTLPFWPSSDAPQFGPTLSSTYKAWKAETTTFRSSFECQNMTLESAGLKNKTFSESQVQRPGLINGTQPMVVYVLTSGDGCRYELTVHPAVDLARIGGVTWSNASTFYPLSSGAFTVGNRLFPSNVSSTSPYARLNASSECGSRDIIIMSTSWTKPFNLSSPWTPEDQAYTRSPTFKMKAFLCEPRYTMIKHTISASMAKGPDSRLENAPGASSGLDSVSQKQVDLSGFQKISLQDDWSEYFDRGTVLSDTQSGTGSDVFENSTPLFSGLGPMLAAVSNFNVTYMMNDPLLIERAARIKGRFFMETLRESFDRPAAMEQEAIQGEATVIEERVVVLTEVGIALATFFFSSFLLFICVFFTSRPSRRPLNLQSDPASVVGLSLLLDPQLAKESTFRYVHNKSKPDVHMALLQERYSTSDGALHVDSSRPFNADNPAPKVPKLKSNWRPRVIRVHMLMALGTFLALVLVAILVLNAFSARSKLSQVAFIYEADVSKFGLSFSTFAPISIAPTVISIIAGLWWDQLDMTFRILQPFISMSRSPTPISTGAGLTYRSKTWAGAAFKAGRNRHWVLFLIAIGSVLAQVLTVSMSALFERRAENVAQDILLNRTLEARQVPIINQVGRGLEEYKNHPEWILDQLYLNTTKNWLYGAATQSLFNGSQLPWTSNGWSFIPIDLSSVPNSPSNQNAAKTNTDNMPIYSANITVNTPAIRARLECSKIDEISNTSSWIESVKIKDYIGYMTDSDAAEYNATGLSKWYEMRNHIFEGTNSHTTILGADNYVSCCMNGTIKNPERAAVGYWSVIGGTSFDPTAVTFPWADRTWPVTISPKWIVGKPRRFQDKYRGLDGFLFSEVPSFQAAQCTPIIEVAEAKIQIEKSTETILSYNITGPTTEADSAWAETFTMHDISNSNRKMEKNYTGPLNITSSYGVLFLDSMLGSSDRSAGARGGANGENTHENAFVIRDSNNGLNMDLMSYSMYALANNDPEAPLNYTTMAHYADQTFRTFFQHFIRSGLSLNGGGYAYQMINDDSAEALGRPIDQNGTVIGELEYPVLNTNRTATAAVSNRIQLLHMNTAATYLSAAILLWLIITALIVTCLQRKYTSLMVRDVELIADVLILVAGSENLLRLIHERGVSFKRNQDRKTMLGWFKGKDGVIRWGIEVVGGTDPVEWVDTPKQGWHIHEKSSSGRQRRLLPW